MTLTSSTSPAANRRRAAFTLAEVLAALLFMAIVIPVAVEGLRIASLAGTVAQRKRQAARLAERVLNETLVGTNWNSGVQTGTLLEDGRTFRWTLRLETWPQVGQTYAPRLLSVDVAYAVQNRDYTVRLTTLAPSLLQP